MTDYLCSYQQLFLFWQTALKGKFKCGKDESEKKEHWLDYAEDKYDASAF